MAESELEEDEVLEADGDDEAEESDGEGDSEADDKAKKKKKQIIIAGAIVGVVILIFIVVAMFFSGPEKSQAQIEEEEAKARKGMVVLTGYGELLVKKIPDLTPIPYSDDYEKENEKSAPTPVASAKSGGVNRPVLPSGEVVYTAGDSTQVGKKENIPGVVLIDSLQVQKGDNNEQTVQARVQNQSSLFLAEVELDIIFLDGRGNTVLARGVNPLVISGGLFGDKVQTLAPGASRVFVVDATNVPPNWSGSVDYKMHSYRFTP
ncbi:MAG: hypothetical protein HQL70_06385 [Magnetococcales bacterium]|nr:hypothetical protein [Magnetococcales bacterium]